MSNERKRKRLETKWTARIPAGVTFASTVIGLLSGAGGLWLLWPQISDSAFGPKYKTSYDYVIVSAGDNGLSCIAKRDATLKIGEKSVGLLQNSCQTKVAVGAAHNDVFRAWYIRITNAGPEIPKLSIIQASGSSDFNLAAGDTTLVCLGYEGRPGRESKDWTIEKMELSDGNGRVQRTVAVRKPPAETQLKTVASNCESAFVGYPPL
jgi:hypothetical protein